MRVTRAVQIVSVVFCLVLTAPLTRDQEFDRRNGTWWMGITRVNKAFYLAGFVDGIVLGNGFSVAGIDKNDKDYKEVTERVAASFSSQRAKYLSNVTHIQLSDRLDAFYGDSTNRIILVHDAVWLVLKQISGTPEKEMRELIESYRKRAEME